ncbi:phage major tail tube protein [Pseudooceanicola sp. HF7]|uniref:phage major tail tube protein n=1 Tax=Pseudooceanicola sp. HF7 TaxID=2721560 RepID=UPI00142FE225|nr:phage major tail tube protein [Pseudooceanicola sp. HF7]NIZ11093.1 phage major tail tube protein [Pseudooceanicola sp. HF7]
MKSTPAYILRNAAMWLNEDVKVGQVSEMTVPPFRVKTETMRNAGMVMEREVPMGYERENAKFKMTALDPATVATINGMPGTNGTLMITGALVDEDGAVSNATVYMRGFLKEVDFGSWASGEKAETDYAFVWEYLKLEIGGATLIEADDFDVSINGTSQTGDIRAALLL